MDSFARLLEQIETQKKETLLPSFFQKEDVTQIAQEILGKLLFTKFQGILTGGIITETEAYKGAEDKACHAYKNRRTKRTEVMFGPGGTAYVYLCYGMHHLFNIVTHQEGTPHAILVRALFPTHGINTMLKRRNKTKQDKTLTTGPGSLSQALGIQIKHTGTPSPIHQFGSKIEGLSLKKKKFRPLPGLELIMQKSTLYCLGGSSCQITFFSHKIRGLRRISI